MRVASTLETRKVWVGAGLLLTCLGLAIPLSLTRFIETSRPVLPTMPLTIADDSEPRPGTNPAIATYPVNATTTIVDLQQFRQTRSIRISSGGKDGTATLDVAWNGSPELSYHLENPAPLSQTLVLDENFSSVIVLIQGGNRRPCNLFSNAPASALEEARASKSIFAPLCEARLYLRNPAKGQRTGLEAATEFLRTQVWGGEKVIVLFHHLLEDTHRETGKLHTETPTSADARAATAVSLPLPALIDPDYSDRVVASTNLGIDAEKPERDGLRPGAWYVANANPGIYISIKSLPAQAVARLSPALILSCRVYAR